MVSKKVCRNLLSNPLGDFLTPNPKIASLSENC